MTFTLNLAGLTDEELHALLGDDRALAALPDVSRARLSGRPVPGPELPDRLVFTPLHMDVPGSTPDQTRVIAQYEAELVGHGATALPGIWHQETTSVSMQPYGINDDTALLVRWNERDPAAGVGLHVLTWLRDQASGSSAVLTVSRSAGLVPAPSELIDVHVHPGVSGERLLELHAGHVLRHGRTRRLSADGAWWEPWQALYELNLVTWQRRGLLLSPRMA
ncbi:hypothetical protein E7T09_03580 [Deinococcus sp. KSM4-11]|uniref:hypothetical protein n=1 Tax=Deinococcus sp. KSM4-11 TaxID=2568654 RepID=UPI0010A4D5C5|nr:hypothetical protein [Deinococcus sp. KSM4-11]THF88296.1 hypothetical protein E7T09_03580 [Deinococcus sp. KSM4-11]